jgi:hypothetical protein
MKNIFAIATAVVACLAAIAYAASSPQQRSTPPVAGATSNTRFTIHNGNEGPILLDTATGNTWTIQASTNVFEVADARMVAWIPMVRIDDDDQFKSWLEKATAKYNRFVSVVKEKDDALARLNKKRNELGVDHPDVVKLQQQIWAEESWQQLTVEQMLQRHGLR